LEGGSHVAERHRVRLVTVAYFPMHFLCGKGKACYLGRMVGYEKRGVREANCAETGKERFLARGGHDNPLKKLDSDKEIQGNPSLFL
jgi:hypothetical protein